MKTRAVPLVTFHKAGCERLALIHAQQTGLLDPEVLSSVRWNWDIKGLDSAQDIALTVTYEIEEEDNE